MPAAKSVPPHTVMRSTTWIRSELIRSIRVFRKRYRTRVAAGWLVRRLATIGSRTCTVFGIESDWAWTNAKASTVVSDGQEFPPSETDNITVTSKLRWFGTTRIRTGVVVDNLLLYVTGGLAYANFKRDFRFIEDADDDAYTEVFSRSRTRFGWTAGAGTEWAINQNWSLKSEFLYVQFEKDETTETSKVLYPDLKTRFKNDDSAWVGRIGLNYRFGAY
jgi:outer membrane immunogenic protein